MQRLTHKRENGIKTGYWSPNKKQELVDRLAMYEDREDAKDTNVPGKWIPCSERLPEPDEYILLSFSNYSGLVLGRYEEDDGGGAFYEGDSLTPLTQYDVFVNAWMPLPKPYREVDDEKNQ
ncbi:DUF551 domain-containing protein [Dorea sp. AM58-8]|uniref:DUF551 domain-containing protein n=1 Tax=Dorea sp. AM58-8 TaxID=2292346 RepID=UPI000E4ABC15|nr:DUF551 domain-containing protein [Dorea sp. AM58-8]RGY83195.1 DUF551 domain-containing protein [Dorea sp. AM58-8]